MKERKIMASNTIPKEINQYRPGPCTEIKLINGNYYVYMYNSVRLPSGRWGKKTGKSIGKIVPGKGFIPNKNYSLYINEESQDEITITEYGQYALIDQVAGDVKASLEKHFPLDRAAQIFSCAAIMVANGFTHIDQIQSYYEQSWLAQQNKSLNIHMGKTSVNNMLDDLGRRTTRVNAYEQEIINTSSLIAIDGHAIRSSSEENDLSESGYKYNKLGDDQVNLLMGYDLTSKVPVFSRMYRGSCNDKVVLNDLLGLLHFSGLLFTLDGGFYTKSNLELLSQNDNSYIIPVPANTNVFKNAMRSISYTDSFYYSSGKKHSRIEYMETRISNTESVYVFRDIDDNEKSRYNYLHSIELGKAGYTRESLEKNKEYFGVCVLQSNSGLKPEEIFTTYKKRWGIETLYQYIKNNANFNNLMIQDYYKEQGLSFIMLISAQIHQKMIAAVKKLNDNTISTNDILLMARCMKMERRGNVWMLKNTRKRDLDLLKKIGFEPEFSVVAD